MTKKELDALLEQAYKEHYLNAIELLTKNEKNYRRSEFFKNTRIPLFELYKNFYLYKRQENDLQNQIEKFLLEFNVELFTEKVTEIIESLKNNDRIKNFIEKLSQDLDPTKIESLTKKLEGALKNLKK